MTLVWVALIVGVVALVVAIAFVVMRALQLWRTLRAFFSAVGGSLDELSRRVEAIASNNAPELDRLAVSLEQLKQSTEQLAVLRNAIARVREQASAALVFYPRK